MTKQNLSVKIEIPFSGFYESIWDYGIDHEIEMTANWMAEHSNFEVDECDISEVIFDHTNFAAMREKIAESYAVVFLHQIGLAGEFGFLSSPKFYNYFTDKIYCYISENQALAIVCDSLLNTEFSGAFYSYCQQFYSHIHFIKPSQWMNSKNSEVLFIVFFEFYFRWQIENEFSQPLDEFEFSIFDNLRGNSVFELHLDLQDEQILELARKEATQ